MIKSVIYNNIKIIIIYLMALVSFAGIAYLYNLPVYKNLYAIEIFTFLTLSLMIIDSVIYIKKYKKLNEAFYNMSIYEVFLPESTDGIENIYKQMIEKLFGKSKEIVDKIEEERSEQLEYYMMWVHQIKTPIAALKLLLESGKEEPIKMEQQLLEIEQYAEMALQYLRIGNISGDLILRKCNLDKVVKGIVKKYSVIFINKKLSIEVGDINIDVLTDEKWLEFLIEQILSNSLKYTRKGKITIEFIKDTLYIKDTGIGIRSEDIKRIYEKGFTGYNGRIDKKASGIGLYLANMVANKLTHELVIESKEGIGTNAMIIFRTKDIEIY